MFVKDVMVQNKVGLHARPATFFIQKANEYKSSIWVEREDRRVNAKSLLGVLSLGIVGGTTINIIADGAATVRVLICISFLKILKGDMCAVAFSALSIVSPCWSSKLISFSSISFRRLILMASIFTGIS